MVGGPHDSSDGRAVTIEEREIGIFSVEAIVRQWWANVKSPWRLRLKNGIRTLGKVP